MGEFEKRISLGDPKLKEGFIRACPHDTIAEYDCNIQWIMDIVREAKKEFQEAVSMRDYLILVEKWFGK